MNNPRLPRPEITESPSFRKRLALSDPANEDTDAFIPLEPTVEKIKTIVDQDGGSTTFIRAPVAAGKTTLAKYLDAEHGDKFVLAVSASNETEQTQNIIEAIEESGVEGLGENSNLPKALKSLASNDRTLILDEAHMLFRFPNLLFLLLKVPQYWKTSRLKVLFFSAASESTTSQGEPITAPGEIRKKYMWYSPMPDANVMAEELAAAEVFRS